MRKKSVPSISLVAIGVISLLIGCTSSNKSDNSNASKNHEPISICNPFRDVNAFIDVVHKYYPEINFEVLPYAGSNATAYMQAQLRSGEMPDVYTTSVYTPGQYDSADKLNKRDGKISTKSTQSRLYFLLESTPVSEIRLSIYVQYFRYRLFQYFTRFRVAEQISKWQSYYCRYT